MALDKVTRSHHRSKVVRTGKHELQVWCDTCKVLLDTRDKYPHEETLAELVMAHAQAVDPF